MQKDKGTRVLTPPRCGGVWLLCPRYPVDTLLGCSVARPRFRAGRWTWHSQPGAAGPAAAGMEEGEGFEFFGAFLRNGRLALHTWCGALHRHALISADKSFLHVCFFSEYNTGCKLLFLNLLYAEHYRNAINIHTLKSQKKINRHILVLLNVCL